MKDKTRENITIGFIIGTAMVIILLYFFGDMVVDWIFHKLMC